MPSLLPFVLFALVATLTPGPTNILVLSHGARFGLRATLPLVLGACLAAALSLLGALWLSWLAWTLWRGAAEPLAPAAGRAKLGPCGAALLQAVNPKVWMMAVAVVGVFAVGAPDRSARVMQLSLIFLLMALPCMSLWAMLGAGSARLLCSPRRLCWLNRSLALLLLASTWLALLR